MFPVVTLNRNYRPGSTLGRTMLPTGEIIHWLERPWISNQRNVSCIPPGFYQVKYLERSASGKYKRCWHVQNVPGRSGILIHSGNFVRDTLGCLLPGTTVDMRAGAVYHSRSAMEILRKHFGDFWLLIQ